MCEQSRTPPGDGLIDEAALNSASILFPEAARGIMVRRDGWYADAFARSISRKQQLTAKTITIAPTDTGPRYDGAIMVSRTQISLEQEIHLLARRRAGDLGVSLAEYIRRLVARDLGNSPSTADPAAIFDLGASDESDIATDKDTMIAAAFASTHDKKRRR